jgi:hypothetical protein
MWRKGCWMSRAENARGKVRGALPRIRARGTPPETPGRLCLPLHVPERSSPSRVPFAAHQPRALDGSGPFRRFTNDKGKAATTKAKPFLVRGSGGLPLVGPELLNKFGVDKTS